MKKIISIITLFSFCIISLNAGQISIHLQDGNTDSFDISEIDNITFEQGGTGTVTDIDGNVYQTIIIGDQEWMMENLKVTHYRNGDSIPHLTDDTDWANTSSGAYCVHENDSSNVDTYGNLYNWYTVEDSCGLAPEGWHVPTDGEWQILIDYLGGSSVAGGKMKEAGFEHWLSPNTDATNECGFTALPGSCRGCYSGSFGSLGKHAYFWSTDSYGDFGSHRRMDYNNSHANLYEYQKNYGFSIRCLRD